jgi:AcrR family transcriptional regulator
VVQRAPGCAATAERPPGLHADRDPQIYAAALALLREIGYERMAIDAVAARARVSKATIYRRWPGKPQMVADALRNHKFEVHVPVDTGTLRGDLLAMLRAAARICTADASLMLAVAFAMQSNPELGRLMRDHVLPAKRMESEGIIDRAVARGEIAPDDRVRELFHGLAPALLMSRLAAEGLPVDDEYLRCVVDHVLLPVLKQ